MRHVIAALLMIGMMGGGSAATQAQSVDSDYGTDALTSRHQPMRVVLQPTYQYYEDNGVQLTEWSLPLQATIPIRERLQLSVRASVASADGEVELGNEPEQVSGLGDVQASLSYTRELGEGSLIMSAGVNAPTGKQELTLAEFTTATLLSRNFYDFRVPSFGQGLGLATGATWALPVGDDLVLGLGGSFQYQGGFTPFEGMEETYEPGNEVLATGGLDYRLSRTSALSGDVALTLYGTDTLGDTDEFEAGNKVSAKVQYVRNQRYNTLRLMARYEGREKSTFPATAGGATEMQLLPNQGTLRGSYTTRLREGVRLEVEAIGRHFGETTSTDSKTLVTVSLMPQFDVGDGLRVAPRVAYTGGSFTGLEGGLMFFWQR